MDIATDRGPRRTTIATDNTGLTTCRCYCFIITIKILVSICRYRQIRVMTAVCESAFVRHTGRSFITGYLNAILAIFLHAAIAYKHVCIIVGLTISCDVHSWTWSLMHTQNFN